MSIKGKTDRNDIFNPKYREKKSFTRKENLKKIVLIVSVLAVFIWGSRDFIYGYITGIEVQNMRHEASRPILDISGHTGYFIINRASYNVILFISCSADNFTSSYNNQILIPNQIIYINFYGIVSQDMEIVIKGVKV